MADAGGGAAPAPADEEVRVVGFSCGSSHSVCLLSCDVVAAWGRGEDGQLGHGDAQEVLVPKAVRSMVGKRVQKVHCGAEYTVALADNGRVVYSWGWGDFGRLGHGDCNDVFVPQPISFFSSNGLTIAEVACGDTHTLAVTEGGELYAFGRNQNGQLGLGHTNDMLLPTRVAGELQGKRVVSLACGAEHSLVATDDSQIFSWGWGRYGNLGDNDCQDRHLPTRVLGMEGQHVARVECGWRHSAVVTREGRVFTFGWSKYGQLGHGDFTDRWVPKLVEALQGVVVSCVAGGWRHTMAADSQGNLYAWGWNKFGQLGLGDCEDRCTPTIVAKLSVGQQHQGNGNGTAQGAAAAAPAAAASGSSSAAVAVLACGWRHTVAVTAEGQVFSWGRGVNGQLGLGVEEDTNEPQLVRSLCRGVVTKEAILATMEPAGAPGATYVAPADRYAVVPDSEVPGNGVADDFSVPSVPPATDPGSAAKRQRT